MEKKTKKAESKRNEKVKEHKSMKLECIKVNKEEDKSHQINNSSDQDNSTNVKRGISSFQTRKESDSKKESRKRALSSRERSDEPVEVKKGTASPSSNTNEDVKDNSGKDVFKQYTLTNYGTDDLSVEEWEKCDENYKLHLLFEDILKKRQEVLTNAAAVRQHTRPRDYNKYDCSSEKLYELRKLERTAIEKWTSEITKIASGKYKICEFLVPVEFKKFKEAVKRGKELTYEDYKRFKLNKYNMDSIIQKSLEHTKGPGAEGSSNSSKKSYKAEVKMPPLKTHRARQEDKYESYRRRMMMSYHHRQYKW